jgi:hypothetical protein
MPIEKNIWQIWFQGERNMKMIYRESAKNWKRLNPEWNYACVDDAFLCKTAYEISDKIGRYYENCLIMHMKIDLGKLLLCYQFGGAYFDCDTIPIRSIESSHELSELITDHRPAIGLSAPALSVMGDTINNGIILCSKNNIAMLEFITSIVSEDPPDQLYGRFIDPSIVTATTGPRATSKFFEPRIGTYTNMIIKLFPYTFFEACRLGTCDIQPETICIHSLSLSWLPNEAISVHEKMTKNHNRIKMFSSLTTCVLIMWLLYTRSSR